MLYRVVRHGASDANLPQLERIDGIEVLHGYVTEHARRALANALSGCLEAIIVPSISLIIAGFYRKSEQPPRNALVFAAASSIVNGFLSWAVGHIPASAPLSIWQYLFLITG
jgi:hypothetical protein